MSTTAAPANSPEMALLLANIARAQEETGKFAAEQHKLTAEAAKLSAEAANLRVLRFVTPTAPVIARWLGLS